MARASRLDSLLKLDEAKAKAAQLYAQAAEQGLAKARCNRNLGDC
jgi:TPR repeat protein